MARDKTHKLQLHKTIKKSLAKLDQDTKKGLDPFIGGRRAKDNKK